MAGLFAAPEPPWLDCDIEVTGGTVQFNCPQRGCDCPHGPSLDDAVPADMATAWGGEYQPGRRTEWQMSRAPRLWRVCQLDRRNVNDDIDSLSLTLPARIRVRGIRYPSTPMSAEEWDVEIDVELVRDADDFIAVQEASA